MRAYRISKWAILFVFAIGAVFLCHSIWRNHNVIEARRWPATDAIVSSCQITSYTNLVERRWGNRIERHDEVTFAFTYTVAGHQYVSTRFYPLGQYQPKNWLVRQYQVGRHFAAHYNPNAPEQAVVEPGDLNFHTLVIAIFILGSSVLAVIYNFFQR